MMKFGVMRLLLIMVFLTAGEVLGELHGRAAYTAARAKLEASSIDGFGWSLKNDELVSLASGAELELRWGDRWFEYFYIEGYSTSGLFPVEIGSNEQEISASGFAALFGLPGRMLPSFKLSSIKFNSIAVSDGTIPIYEDGRELAKGEEFDVGLTFTTYLLVWDLAAMLETEQEEEGDKHKSSASFLYGVGAAHIKNLGVQQEYQEDGSFPAEGFAGATSEGWGFEIYTHFDYGSAEIAENTYLSIAAHGEIAMLNRIGAMMKVGYEFALDFEPQDNLQIRPYIGGYFWPFLNWQDDFAAVESDVGYSYGVKVSYFW